MTTSGWPLRRITDPDAEPITVADARDQCQIDSDIEAHDAKLAEYIKAARELAESYTKLTFVETAWRLSGPGFPVYCGDWGEVSIALPMGPIIAVDRISYVDNTGARVDLATTGYQLLDDESPAQLIPPYQQTWPTNVQSSANSLQIEYRAGYLSSGSPAGADKVPNVAKQAIRMMVAHWFNNREDTSITNLQTIPNGFERLLDSIRVYP